MNTLPFWSSKVPQRPATSLLPTGRRWLLAAALGLFGLGSAQAQALNYATTGASNVAGTFTDLGTTGTVITTANNDDANSTPQNIGFTFFFNGSSFTQFVLSTNGFIKLGSAAPSATDLFLCQTLGCTNIDPVSSTNPADVNLILPFNFDLEPATTGTPEYRVAVTGTAPNQVCTIQWKNVRDKADANVATQFSSMTFQAKLYEGSNRVEFVYGPYTPTAATAVSRFPIVGLKGSGSANGQTVLAEKATGAGAWTTTTFITGYYTGPTHNFRNVAPPDPGRTYRFNPTSVVSCAGATGLTAGSVTNTSASIGFTPAASGITNYTVSYQAGNGAPTSVPAVTSSPVSLTGLALGTTYTVTITGNCSGGGTSAPATVTFTTTGGPPAYCNTNLGGFCGGNDITAVSILGTTLNATGLTCNTTAAGDTYTSYPLTPASNTATLNPGNAYQLSVATEPGSIVSAWIDFNRNGQFEASEWTQVTTSSTTPANAVSISIPLTAVQGVTGLRIRSRASGSPNGATDPCTQFFSGETKDFAITIGAPAACPTVGGATLTNVTATGATLAFTASTSASNYTVTLTPQGGGSPIVVTPAPSTSPVTLSGLTPSTTYSLSIVSNCSGSTTSSPFVLSLTTACAAAPYTLVNNTTPYAQDFEATWTSGCNVRDLPANNWRNTPATGDDSWRREDDGTAAGWTNPTFGLYTPTGSTLNGATGIHSARFHSSFLDPSTGGNVTGSLDLYLNMAGTSGTPTLSFDYIKPEAADALVVEVSTNGGTSFSSTPLATLPTASAWTSYVANLPATGLTATTIVRFRATGSYGFDDLGIDNVRVAYVACPAAINLTATNVTGTGATITFTPSAGATNYTVTLTPQGGTATTITPAPTGSPITLTGLSQGVQYTVGITSNCSSSQTSTLSTVTFTTTTPLTAYCAAQGGVCATADITAVNIASTSLNATGLTCNTVNGNAYQQFFPTTTNTTATLAPGSAYNLTVTTSASAIVSVWIDFDQNGQYDASEWTQVTTAGTGASTIGLSIPASAVAGQTGMRIRSRSAGNQNGATDACTSFGSGETKDFLITIGVPVPCNAPTGLSSTNITTTGAQVTFTPSTTATSYTVTYQAGTGTPVTVTPNPTASPVTLTGLTPGTAYTIRIVSNCAGGATSAGSVTNFSTNSLPTCGTPTNVAVTSITPTSANVTFTPSANASTYTVTYTPTGGTAQTVSGSGSPIALTGLTANSAYSVTVRANCTGTSTPSSTASAALSFNTGTATRNAALAALVSLHPNPAQRVVTLSIPAGSFGRSASLALYNSLGQQVQQQELSLGAAGTSVELNLSGLAAGVYSVQLKAGADLIVKRLVIE